MDKLAKVRAEVERLHNEYRTKKGALYFRKALRTVLFIIDSMPEEPVSEDLEKAARKYAGIPEDSPHDLKYCVQDKKAKYDAVLYGANWQKKQMMKDAIDATVESDPDSHGADYGLQKLNIDYGQLEAKGIKPSTKVKVIVI